MATDIGYELKEAKRLLMETYENTPGFLGVGIGRYGLRVYVEGTDAIASFPHRD